MTFVKYVLLVYSINNFAENVFKMYLKAFEEFVF